MSILTIGTREEDAIEAACGVLAGGGLIALPTETVYGLAADATNGEAVARIFEAKGRPRFNPLICHVSDLDMARRYVRFDAKALRLAGAFWPGPLTLVLPSVADTPVHALARAGLESLAVRVPGGFAQRLIARFNRPLAAPSANRSGRISPTLAQHVAADLGDRVDLILDGGAAAIGLESTIVKPQRDGVVLLRPGGLATEEIEDVLGTALIRREAGATAIEAPGMLRSHYAPRKPIRINADRAGPGDVVITFGRRRISGDTSAARILDLSPNGDLREAAANLFQYLTIADASDASHIAVVPLPTVGLGEAINDRLMRAAAPSWDQGVLATDD